MEKENERAASEKLAEFRQALAAARKLQQDWITYGVESVDHYVEDIDGDWWETWGADKEAGNGRSPGIESEQSRLAAPSSTVVNLRPWLQNNFAKTVEAGWQTMEKFFGSRQASLAVRYAAGQRSKLIDLGIGNPVALIITLTPEEEEEITVLLQLRPTESQTLPSGLKLILGDASGDRISESTATEEDEFIQGQYSCQPGFGFTVTVALGDASVTENFTF